MSLAMASLPSDPDELRVFATLLQAEANGQGKILLRFGDLVKDFHIHVIFATNKLIASRPDAIRAFLEAWFETIAFMRADKATTVAIAEDIISVDPAITARTYDELMPMFSADGKFNPKALVTLSRSYVDLKILPTEPTWAGSTPRSFCRSPHGNA